MPITGQLLPGVKDPVIPAFSVSNSLRFNDDDTAYMTSPTRGTATSQKKGTFSFWIKLSEIGQVRMMGTYENSNNEFQVKLTNDSQLEIYQIAGGSNNLSKKTNRKFRDPSAWMHIVIAIDCTLTAGSEDVVKVYVNGTRETSFATNTNNMPLNHSFHGFYQGLTQRIGADAGSTSHTYDGYFAEFVYIDGQQLDADSFGEFDSDSPTIWKPIDVSGLTFGNNGYYLQFKQSGTGQNSSGLGADTSGNDNHFAVTNLAATDQSTDTCTNNFATLNSVAQWDTGGSNVYSEGNLKCVLSSNFGKATSTIGVTQGKWYMEVKQTAENIPLGNGESVINVIGDPIYTTSNWNGYAQTFGLRNYNGYEYTGTTEATSRHGNWTVGDIIGVALDMDNLRVYFSKNGQFYDGSGNWDESSPNAYISLSSSYSTYFLCLTLSHDSATETFEVNFGSPSFSISSGNSDGNGYGNFEYSVPSGYYALNTKNLAEFG